MKRFWIILTLVLVLICISACSYVEVETANEEETTPTSMFVVVETTSAWKVVYCKNTKVMYAVSNGGGYSWGNFTLLVKADGTPMLYEGGE